MQNYIDTDTTTPTARADWDTFTTTLADTYPDTPLSDLLDEYFEDVSSDDDLETLITHTVAPTLLQGLLAGVDPAAYGHNRINDLHYSITIEPNTDGEEGTVQGITIAIPLTPPDGSSPFEVSVYAYYAYPNAPYDNPLTGVDAGKYVVTGLAPLIRAALDRAAYVHHALTVAYPA